MHELTGLKSNSATNHIQDKDGNIIKNAYLATNKFTEHFWGIHKVFKDPTESHPNIHFSRLESMTQRKLNNQHFSIPYITCDFVNSQLIHLEYLNPRNLTRAQFHNNLIRLNFNPKYVRHKYTFFSQVY